MSDERVLTVVWVLTALFSVTSVLLCARWTKAGGSPTGIGRVKIVRLLDGVQIILATLVAALALSDGSWVWLTISALAIITTVAGVVEVVILNRYLDRIQGDS